MREHASDTVGLGRLPGRSAQSALPLLHGLCRMRVVTWWMSAAGCP